MDDLKHLSTKNDILALNAQVQVAKTDSFGTIVLLASAKRLCSAAPHCDTCHHLASPPLRRDVSLELGGSIYDVCKNFLGFLPSPFLH